MTADELKKKYFDFFVSKGHAIIPGAPLVPEHDPSVLFTTAGMHPLVPFLLGEKHPAGKRLVNIQKCVRTDDIDEVGDGVHHTFFYMLGNWSLGDYWKPEAIQWSFEFLTKELRLPVEKLAVSVFSGDNDAPRDKESAEIWQSLGIPQNRIYYLGKKDNWWGPAGKTGPCGPDTEMFYWAGKGEPCDLITGDNKQDWVEVWNDVFMQYNKTSQGAFEPLPQKNVDTGMGLERTLTVLNNFSDDYQTELFTPLIQRLEQVSGRNYGESEEITRAMRVIADHIRAAVFLLFEHIEPSNVEHGYIIRRLIRRAVRYGKMLGIGKPFCEAIARSTIEYYKLFESRLAAAEDFILQSLTQEEQRFLATLERGVRRVEKLIQSEANLGKAIFDLYQSYGFPFELAIEELNRHKVDFDAGEARKLFDQEYQKHQELSRLQSGERFKGGLAETGDMEIKRRYHTATHLLQAALRAILGDRVRQKGSNITAERLRFDFSHSGEITPKQIAQIEQWVNERIKQDLLVVRTEMDNAEADSLGVLSVPQVVYGPRVSVYTIADPAGVIYSREKCGGPHSEHTGELGEFKLIKLEAIGQGVKRIKASLV